MFVIEAFITFINYLLQCGPSLGGGMASYPLDYYTVLLRLCRVDYGAE